MNSPRALSLFRIGVRDSQSPYETCDSNISHFHNQICLSTRIILYFALLCIVPGCSKSRVGEIASQLGDDDGSVRYEAAKALEIYGPEAAEAVPELAEGLSDSDPKVRYRCAKTLSKIGMGAAPAAVSLAAALDKAKPKTRYYLVKTLANIEDSAIVAIAELIQILKEEKDDKIRYYAAKALGKIGPDAKSAIPVLEKTTKNADTKLRKAAHEALVKVRT